MSKNQYRSTKLEKKKKNLLILRIVFWVVAALVALYGIVFWFNHESLRISEISVAETKFTPRDHIEKITQTVLDTSYIGLFSKRNKLFLPTTELRHEIQRAYPAIEDVRIYKTSAHAVRIDIKEYEAVAKWCGDDARVAMKLCYVMNDKGQFFAQETAIFTFDVPIFFGDISEENIIGTYYVPIELFQKLMTFIRGLSDLHITFSTLETEDFETFVINTVKGPYLMIDKDDDTAGLLDNLRIVIEQEEINKAQLKNLIYIDLRHGNKVFYKIGVPAV